MENKTLTIKELIEKKEKISKKKSKRETLFVKSFESDIVITAPTSSLILEAQEMGEDDATRADMYLVFECVVEPDLKDKSLHEAYGCADPIDIVNELFLPGEVAGIADKIMKLGGFGGSVEIKN